MFSSTRKLLIREIKRKKSLFERSYLRNENLEFKKRENLNFLLLKEKKIIIQEIVFEKWEFGI